MFSGDMNAGCEKCNIGELRLDGSSTDILLSGILSLAIYLLYRTSLHFKNIKKKAREEERKNDNCCVAAGKGYFVYDDRCRYVVEVDIRRIYFDNTLYTPDTVPRFKRQL